MSRIATKAKRKYIDEDEEDIIGEFLCKVLKAIGLTYSVGRQGNFV